MAEQEGALRISQSSQQRMIVTNTHGEKLVGVLNETASRKVVILCHGFRSSKDDQVMLNLATAITNQGLSVLRFDFSGNGESEGVFQFGNYWREAEDLRSVVVHLLEQKYEVSAIFGHSKGGDIVLLYASKYHDVPFVFDLSGRFNLARGIEERVGQDFMQRLKKDGFIDVKDKKGKVLFKVTEESLMDRINTDMHVASLSIDKDCRVFIVHGSEDEVIPVEDAYEFAKFIPNNKLHIVEGANHCYTAHQEELARVVVDLLKSCEFFIN